MFRNFSIFITALTCNFCFAQTAKLPVTITDNDSIHDVTEPSVSPDGKWVAYTVSSTNFEEDDFSTDIWMTSWDGKTTLQLTYTEAESESKPRWSPDNNYLAFHSSRTDSNEVSQLWLLNRAGGEAKKITSFAGGVEDYAWSFDGKKIAVIASIIDTAEYIEGTETAVPLVIDRYYFKEDYSEYLTTSRKHLYVLDVATEDTIRIADGDFEEELPSWSPDGKHIAFVSKRAREDWDRDDNYDIYIVEAKAHSKPRQLTTSPGKDNDPSYEAVPAWSPDGKYIAFTIGGPLKLIYYAIQHLAIIPVEGGTAKILTAAYDRNIWNPQWSADGKEIYFIGEDDQNLDLNKISINGGEIKKVISGRHTIYNYELGGENRIALQYTNPLIPEEIFVQDENGFRKLSHQNDGWLSRHQLATTKEFQSKSKDGTLISGFMVLPNNYVEGKKYPTILQIHGGPTSQNQNEWAMDWQLYAAWGYVTVSMNPRGSTTKGEKFATAIFADWGSVDVQDDLSGVDYLVNNGIADPDKLAVEGWSYGGIATNFTIVQDHRFKCAISGASIGNALAGYGTDMYIREYEGELGTPWQNFDTYVKNSLPFLHADRIKTPTLFMCGAKDFNVPLLNSEQMYQALKSLGIETQLIIYPDQYHGIDVPSYLRDRYERRKDWFDAHLKQ
ncbi:MAG: S9 family peptidase [Chitinophagales bacterium]